MNTRIFKLQKIMCQKQYSKLRCCVRTIGGVMLMCFSLVSPLLLSSCRANQSLVYSTVETTAISSGLDGTYVLRVQGKGPDFKTAYENARKLAVRDMIFRNIHTTFGDHKLIFALVNNPGLEQKNASFFNNFFSDNGAYLNFIGKCNEDERRFSSSSTKCVIINVLVKRSQLQEMLNSVNLIY